MPKIKQLPSTYIKFWWSNQLIDTATLFGTMCILFVTIALMQKVIKIWHELKN